MLSDSANFWQKHTPGNLKQTHYTLNSYLVLYVRTVPCKKSDSSQRTLRRWPLSVRLVIEPESRTFFKSLGYLNI